MNAPLDLLAPPQVPDLEQLTKDELIDMHRAVFGHVGDTGRTPKGEYIARLSGINPDALARHFANAIANRPATTPAPTMPRPAPVAVARPAAPAADAMAQLQQALASLVPVPSVDEETVRMIVDERVTAALSTMAPVVHHHVITPASETKLEEHTHPLFPKVLRLVAAGVNVLLVGPAGCGKTHLAGQVARALSLDYGSISLSAGVSESALLGWLLPVGDGGRFDYVPSQFVSLYEQGSSLFLFDELDAADPNLLLAVNSALANGHMAVPQRHTAPMVHRGARCYMMGSANTHLQGADMIYQGRNAMDGATTDRWYIVSMDYDATLEARLSGLSVPAVPAWEPADEETAPAECAILAQWVLDLRARVNAAKLRRIVSTRTLQKAIAARRAGVPLAEVKRDILAGWTRDELTKAGEVAA